MTQGFGKWPKYLGNGLDTWDTALVFEKRLYYVGNGLKGKSSQKTSGPKYVSCGFKNRFLCL